MRYTTSMTLALLALVLVTTGCSTAISQSTYAVIGARGAFYELQAVSPSTLATYERVEARPFASELADTVPGDVLKEINSRLPAVLAEEKLFFPEGKTLVVQGRVIHYTGKSGVEGAIRSILGAEECVCRVTLHDGESGAVLGEAVCWGSVKSAVRRGSSEFGTGVGKGVAKWIEARLPEPERDRREEALTPEK